MKATDFRIGNSALFGDDKTEGTVACIDDENEVTYRYPEHGVGLCGVDEVDPIPLTEEWLKKFGLKPGDIVHDDKRNPFIVGDKKLIPAKLFAVTQDIKVGDEIICDDRPDIGEQEVLHKSSNGYIVNLGDKTLDFIIGYEFGLKILGELSPNATWVKDGNKIEVELFAHDKLEEYAEAKLALGNPLQIHPLNSYPLKERIGTIICKVKCPTCNTYH